MDRRKFLKGVGVAGVAGLAGCTGGPTENDSTEPSGGGSTDETTSTGTEGNASGNGSSESTDAGGSGGSANIGMVYATGGLGDGSFNDQAQVGLQKAADEFDIQYNESEPEQATEFKTYQQSYAESTNPNYDLVSCIGFAQAEALGQVSGQFPDQNFMIVDATVDADNVANYVFAEHEGSYLVGQLAGLLTTQEFSAGAGQTNGDTTVGFVGGQESGLIKKFEAGYRAGVKAANSDVRVLSSYVGGFNDPAGGKSTANSMYSQGADIIYHASGNTGTGVFAAAQEEGRFAIGVDRDQSVTKSNYANVILASMVKRVDTAVYTSIKSVVNGNFQGGSTTALGLQDDGIAVVYGDGIGGQIPEEVKTQISDSRQGIIDGEIEVPTSP